MAFEKVPNGFTHTFQASTGLSQYQAVNITGANNRLVDPTTEGNVIGVLTSSGTTGSTGRSGSTDSGSVQTVQFGGIAKVIGGTTTINAGDFLKASTDGRCSTASVPSTSYVFAQALESVDSTSTGAHVITALLNTPSFGVFSGISTA